MTVAFKIAVGVCAALELVSLSMIVYAVVLDVRADLRRRPRPLPRAWVRR